ncbi:MAG: diadenylate cyclase CdaA [Lachnospiraceae bacterium]|nr:diadenylate cyclase CdaA [Lachnospiraceae bacterium]
MFQGSEFITTYLSRIPRNVRWVDIIEILIISFLFYQILLWIKNSKAWTFLKGLVVIVVFIGIASICEMTTILWIVKNVLGVAVTALVVLLQPELRRALEELGTRNIFKSILPFDSGKYTEEGLFSDKTIYEIAEACVEMGKAKTGALIVVEQNQKLTDYEKTGIDIDGNISSQLLINIFEHNTPLHDGAVIIRGNKVVSATCYLPLSDNRELSKALGTRHRAGVGISEVSDSMTIIVSEETGKISVAYGGKLERNLDGEGLKAKLRSIQNKPEEEPKKRFIWKGRSKGEK